MKTLLTMMLVLFASMLFAQETQTVAQLLLGDLSFNMFIAAITCSFFGALITILLGLRFRDKFKKETPEKFNWKFFFFDNIKRILVVIFCLIAAIRFYPNLFGEEISLWLAFVLGLGFDGVVFTIKQYTKKKGFKKFLSSARKPTA